MIMIMIQFLTIIMMVYVVVGQTSIIIIIISRFLFRILFTSRLVPGRVGTYQRNDEIDALERLNIVDGLSPAPYYRR